MLENPIRPKDIIITGLSGGNRKTDLMESILAHSCEFEAVIPTTTCDSVIEGRKSLWYTFASMKEFKEMLQKNLLISLTILGSKRMFGISREEYDRAIALNKQKIFRLDHNGIKDFYNLHGGIDPFKKKFCIISLMPDRSSRREMMESQDISNEEIFSRLKHSDTDETHFFRKDPRAECIDAEVTVLTKKTDLEPLAKRIIEYSRGRTQELVLPKSLTAR